MQRPKLLLPSPLPSPSCSPSSSQSVAPDLEPPQEEEILDLDSSPGATFHALKGTQGNLSPDVDGASTPARDSDLNIAKGPSYEELELTQYAPISGFPGFEFVDENGYEPLQPDEHGEQEIESHLAEEAQIRLPNPAASNVVSSFVS